MGTTFEVYLPADARTSIEPGPEDAASSGLGAPAQAPVADPAPGEAPEEAPQG